MTTNDGSEFFILYASSNMSHIVKEITLIITKM